MNDLKFKLKSTPPIQSDNEPKYRRYVQHDNRFTYIELIIDIEILIDYHWKLIIVISKYIIIIIKLLWFGVSQKK